MKILFEDKDIIAVHKNAGIATQTAKLTEKDLYSEVKNYLFSKGEKGTIGIINRLDQPVSGIVLFSKNEKVTAAFTRLMSAGKIQKYYVATVFGVVNPEEGELKNYLKKDGRTNTSMVCNQGDKDAKEARLLYRIIESDEDVTKLSIKLLTGRHHQIRVQMAAAGYPLLGDLKYGSSESIRYSKDEGIESVALNASRLVFPHPVTKKEIIIIDEI